MFFDMIESIAAKQMKSAQQPTEKSEKKKSSASRPPKDRGAARSARLDAKADQFLAANGYDNDGQPIHGEPVSK